MRLRYGIAALALSLAGFTQSRTQLLCFTCPRSKAAGDWLKLIAGRMGSTAGGATENVGNATVGALPADLLDDDGFILVDEHLRVVIARGVIIRREFQDAFQQEFGIVQNLGLSGGLLRVLEIYVGILAATILIMFSFPPTPRPGFGRACLVTT